MTILGRKNDRSAKRPKTLRKLINVIISQNVEVWQMQRRYMKCAFIGNVANFKYYLKSLAIAASRQGEKVAE
jgi:hypothetical protein